jgi:hypothetical protein
MCNPFDPVKDSDRHYIWQRLVAVDSDAFAAADWESVQDDFDAAHFEGIRAVGSTNPDHWIIAFPDLASYRDNWLRAAKEFANKRFAGRTRREAIYHRTSLNQIDITGDRALAHKKFSGDIPLEDGSLLTGSRQTLYRLHRQNGRWRIVGFIGYLPLE